MRGVVQSISEIYLIYFTIHEHYEENLKREGVNDQYGGNINFPHVI